MKKHLFLLLCFLFCVEISFQASAQKFGDAEKKAMCDTIRAACRFAWNGYLQYAAGADELKPLSKQPHNWYAHSLLMTPVDAFDTFILLGMNDEASRAKNMILSQLNFDLDDSVEVFEIVIRQLAALQTAYELDGDKKFLALAEDLANRLMPAFKSVTGMPYRFVNLKTGKTSGSISNPAEIGTLVLEFGSLSQNTGNSLYFNTAKKASLEVFKRRSSLNLIGEGIDVNSGVWTDSDSHVSGAIDSYYEYLLKASILFQDSDFKNAWNIESAAIKKYLLRTTADGSYFTHVNMFTGKETYSYYGALDAFSAGMFALAGDLKTAAEIQKGNYFMWTHFNMEPEVFDFNQDTIVYGSYPLRPENLESCFYLYRFTNDNQYLWIGKRMIEDILKNCKTTAGYASIEDVRTLKQSDHMPSFFFAETLKYAYLLFAPKATLDLSKVVLNTEAHPFSIHKK